MRSVNRIIKIMFLVNFDWMNSLSESLVSTAAILTTVLSVSGTCLAEFLYREKYNMWHIGRSYHSQYLYNLTGADKIELEATTTRTTGDGDGDGGDVLSNFMWQRISTSSTCSVCCSSRVSTSSSSASGDRTSTLHRGPS